MIIRHLQHMEPRLTIVANIKRDVMHLGIAKVHAKDIFNKKVGVKVASDNYTEHMKIIKTLDQKLDNCVTYYGATFTKAYLLDFLPDYNQIKQISIESGMVILEQTTGISFNTPMFNYLHPKALNKLDLTDIDSTLLLDLVYEFALEDYSSLKPKLASNKESNFFTMEY